MSRRVWIIAKRKIEQSDIDNAILNGCPEIVNGIPPAKLDILSEGQLPITFEEPEPPIAPPPRDFEAEIDEIKTKLKQARIM
jgi:hypothetical protein